MWWLAKTACEHVIHPLVFTHVTQSAMVVFIFHRAFEALWVEALPSTSNGVALCFQLIVLNFLGCIAIYALLVLNKWTRFAFGITLAKPEGVAPSKTLVQ